VDGQTDMKRLRVAFRKYTKGPNESGNAKRNTKRVILWEDIPGVYSTRTSALRTENSGLSQAGRTVDCYQHIPAAQLTLLCNRIVTSVITMQICVRVLFWVYL
jgi:hypothetical protein